MPFKDNSPCLGESGEIALRKFGSLLARMSKDKQYLSLYKEFLNEYQQLDHMRQIVEEKVQEIVYYAPHHDIFNPEKSSTKMRVVFNCSSSTTNGRSLNSIQYNGGVIQRDLYSVMLEFRKYIYAFTRDIQKITAWSESQYSLQSILWCENTSETPKTYEILTVTYGTVSALFHAMQTLEHLSNNEGVNFPKAAPALQENFYMDDVLCGTETLEGTKELKQQIVWILRKAGMTLHKIYANHKELPQNPERYSFNCAFETKTLSTSWRLNEDFFIFKVKVNPQDL